LRAESSRCIAGIGTDVLLGRLQDVLNRNVAGSRRAQELARRLDGRALELELSGTPLRIFLEIGDGRIALTERRDSPADARLAGTPLSLLALAGPQAEGRLRSGKVRIEGDAEIAQAFRELLEHTQPDLEEELAQVVGDVAARRVANLARGMLDFGRRATDSLATSAAEYLQEEGRDVPVRLEVEEFLRDVDLLRDDVARLEARLARLAPRRDGKPTRRRRG
jgi:ubiquinone biosynthesis accessory factor UbiJ